MTDAYYPWGRNLVMATTTPPSAEPLTLAQAKLAAGLDWPDGDPRDVQMTGFLAAARRKIETDAVVAFLTQTRTIHYDAVPLVLQLPVRPLQTVTIDVVHGDGTTETLDPSTYVVDVLGGRVAFAAELSDLRAFQPWTFTVTAGWLTPEAVPPELLQLLGLLTAHYATLGRDLALVEEATEVPYGYDDLIAAWTPMVLP